MTLLGGSGCGSQEASAGKQQLTMWTRDDSTALVQGAIDQYNRANDDIAITLSSIPSNNLAEQFVAALSAEEAPDIISMDLILVPYFSSIGAFKEVSNRFNALNFRGQFNQSMVHLGQYEGTQYAFPFSADVSALLYNRQHFRDAGLDPDKPPTTWTEFRKAAAALTREDRYGYVYAGAEAGTHVFTTLPFIWGNGGEWLNADGTRCLIDSTESVEALAYLTDLTREYKVVPPGVISYSSNDATAAFTSQRASMLVSGNFTVGEFNAGFPELDYGVALIPKNEGKQHSSMAGGELVAISSQTSLANEAWDFIQFALSEDVQVESFAQNGTIPVRKDFFDNRYFEEEPRYQVFAEALTVAQTPYSVKYNELFDPYLLSAFQNALRGDESPAGALARAETEMNKVIDR